MARANAHASGRRIRRSGDELAGDLEAVDREPAEVGERRVAGPEVVHGDPDAERAQGVERRDRRADVPEHRGLGHLEGEVARIDAGRPISATTSSMKPGCWSWSGDRLTRQPEHRQAGQAMPSATWRRAVWRTARPSARIVPFSSARRMNSVGSIGAARRVVPAHERLDAHDAAAGQDHDRLVGDGQIASAHAPTELGGQRVAFDDRAVHRRIEDLRRGACRPPWPDTSPRRRCAAPRRPRLPGRTALTPALQPTMTSVPCDLERQLERGDDPLGDGQRVGDGRAGDSAAARTRRHRSARPCRPAGAARRSARRPR